MTTRIVKFNEKYAWRDFLGFFAGNGTGSGQHQKPIILKSRGSRIFRASAMGMLMLLPIWVPAMMANPEYPGTTIALALPADGVEVLQETVRIVLDSAGGTARIRFEYIIRTSQPGIRIPLLFIAQDYINEPPPAPKIFLNGAETEPRQPPQDLASLEGKVFRRFKKYFSNFPNLTLRLPDGLQLEDRYNYDGIVIRKTWYAEENLLPGDHMLMFEVLVLPRRDLRGLIAEYVYDIGLFPALLREKPNQLDIHVYFNACAHPVTYNLPNPTEGEPRPDWIWRYDSIPTPVLKLKISPQPDSFAQVLVWIGPEGFLWLSVGLVIGLHFFLIRRYRKRNVTAVISAWAVTGSVLVPFLAYFLMRGGIWWMNSQIPDEVEGMGSLSYNVLIFPFFISIAAYMPASHLVDVVVRWWFRRKKAETETPAEEVNA